jgi:pimeloyl-ACP methyl ester carboxylesterase
MGTKKESVKAKPGSKKARVRRKPSATDTSASVLIDALSNALRESEASQISQQIGRTRGGVAENRTLPERIDKYTVAKVTTDDGSILFCPTEVLLREHTSPGARDGNRDGGAKEYPIRLRGRNRTRSSESSYAIENIQSRSFAKAIEAAAQFAGAATFSDQIKKYVLRWAFDESISRAAWGLCFHREQSTLRATDTQGIIQFFPDASHPAGGQFRPISPPQFAKIASVKPILLLLHGTASSTEGSFAALFRTDPFHAALARTLAEFEGCIFGFEHRSLTQSPAQNALDLVKHWLPSNAKLHIISHSRGGLIGELLARCASVDHKGEPISPVGVDDLALLNDHPDKEVVEQLGKALEAKKLSVASFVRVACPARGTILASTRLDFGLTLLFNAVKAVSPFVASPFIEALASFIQALVATRADPRVIPGLEAMRPDSALLRVINNPRIQVNSPLHVVACDFEPTLSTGLIWVADLAIDVFYGQANDWVVHTAAMDGGAKRYESTQSTRFFNSKNDTSHFQYFKTEHTANAVLSVLTPSGAAAFESFEVTPGARGAGSMRSADAHCHSGLPPTGISLDRPVVVVMPGIMGSTLTAPGNSDRNEVWLDKDELFFGGLDKLALGEPNIEAPDLIGETYREFIKYLIDEGFDVVKAPFDWRLSISDAADKIAPQIEAWFEIAQKANKPMHIVAHSLGGLVCRALMVTHTALWTKVFSSNESRLLMLGVPNSGSHAIAAMLTARDPIVQMLEILNPDAYKIVSAYPGVLDLLPTATDRENWFDIAWWNRLAALESNRWEIPLREKLNFSLALRKRMEQQLQTGLPCLEKIRYVAGCSEKTPASISFDKFETLGESNSVTLEGFRFLTTKKGDGRVTWESGRIAGVPTWLADTEHGNLPAALRCFAAYVELLNTGTTEKLQSLESVIHALGRSLKNNTIEATSDHASQLAPILMLPSQADLLAAAIGGRISEAGARAVVHSQPIQLEVIHGALDYASFPVMFANYSGDELRGPEKKIDERLDGRLSELISLSLYPRRLGESRVVLSPTFDVEGRKQVGLPGAIVLGLETRGNLTSITLAAAITTALLDYAHRVVDRERNFHHWGSAHSPRISLGVCALVMGGTAYGLTIREFCFALLRGARQAQSRLDPAFGVGCVRFNAIQVIEWLEDRALDVLEECSQLIALPEFDEHFLTPRAMMRLPGGKSRIRFSDRSDTYQRLRIAETEQGVLQYSLIAHRARVELSQQVTQRGLIDRLLNSARTDGQSGIADTLYQLLVPQELKDRLTDGSGTVLLLDAPTARYPWELLLRTGTEGKHRALASQSSLIRQIETNTFRDRPNMSLGAGALIIGDPLLGATLGLEQLPGAREEARRVSEALKAARYDVVTVINGAASSIFAALYQRPYRMLHIAGHGAFEWLSEADIALKKNGQPMLGKPLSGVVLDDGVFLTANEVRNMEFVPDLVFINCCYSGKSRLDTDRSAAVSRIAATVSAELINMGVRAVVAAGWAVDDEIALRFADVFYRNLLDRKTLGESVLAARQVAEAKGGTTWGAYQVYGEPHFRLETNADAPRAKNSRYHTARDLENQLKNLRADATVTSQKNVASLIEKAQELDEIARSKGYLDVNFNGIVASEIGRLYAELASFKDPGMFALAIARLDSVLKKDAASTAISDLDVLANMRGRYAAYLVSRAAEHRLENCFVESGEQFAAADTLLNQVEELAPLYWQTCMLKVSLLGRQAWAVSLATPPNSGSRKAILKLLKDSSKCAASALQLIEKTKTSKENRIYALNGMVLSVTLRRVLGEKVGSPKNSARSGVTELRALTARGNTTGEVVEFWSLASSAHAQLVLALHDHFTTKKSIQDEALRLQEEYEKCFARGCSRRDWSSVLDQFEGTQRLLEYASKMPATPHERTKLKNAAAAISKLYERFSPKSI